MGDIVKASEVANFLKLPLFGEDINLAGVSSLNSVKNNSLVFAKKNIFDIPDNVKCLMIVPIDYNMNNSISVIKVENPRLEFAKVLNKFFSKKTFGKVNASSQIGINVTIDTSVSIGMNCVIGDNVTIGAKTIINSNVVINENTIIGSNCYIKSGSIIGEDGFGFDFEKDGTPIRLLHLGSVIIEDNVEIGSKNTIARGTMDNTVIQTNVKMDDQVHIAHNCNIGKNTIITACSEISGSVIIGENCWIGPNSSIIQKVKIGNNVTIGIGSVVTKNIVSNKKVMGFNALDLRSLLKLKKRISFGN